MSTFSERLAELMLDRTGTERGNAAFARMVDLTEGTIRSYLRGGLPKLDVLVKIAEGSRTEITWLATGAGPRDSRSTVAHSPYGTQQEQGGPSMLQLVNREELEKGAFVLVPRFVDVRLSAGPGLVPDEDSAKDFVAFEAAYLRSSGINPAAAQLVQVDGRSMMPELVHGEWVIVDTSSIALVDGSIYAVVFGESVLVKRLRRERRDAVLLVSDNKDEGYADKLVEGEDLRDFRIVGRVRRHIRSL